METPQPWGRGAFPLSVTEAGGDLVNAVCGTLSFLPLTTPGCVPEESLLSSYCSLKFHIRSQWEMYVVATPESIPKAGWCPVLAGVGSCHR